MSGMNKDNVFGKHAEKTRKIPSQPKAEEAGNLKSNFNSNDEKKKQLLNKYVSPSCSDKKYESPRQHQAQSAKPLFKFPAARMSEKEILSFPCHAPPGRIHFDHCMCRMNNKCFVPKCKNSVGVPFPRNLARKQRWLEGLQLAGETPSTNSFVCFAHFHPSDLHEDSTSGRSLSNKLRRGAVPCIPRPVVKADSKEQKLAGEICRGCMTDKDLETHMSDFIEDDVTISTAFTMCVSSIEVSKYDSMPKYICKTCLNILEVAYQFRKMCIATDEILRAREPQDGRKRKAAANQEPDKTSKKNRRNSEAEPEVGQHSHSVDIDPFPSSEIAHMQFPSSNKDKRRQRDTFVDSRSKIYVKNKFEVSEDKLDVAEGSSRFHKLKDEIKIEETFNEIHGQGNKYSGEQLEAQVLVKERQAIASTNSDVKEGTTVGNTLNTLEEGNSCSDDQNVLDKYLKKTDDGPIRYASTSQAQKKIVVKSNVPMTAKDFVVPSNIRLPKDVKMKAVERFQSATGKFSSAIKMGIYSSFVQVDTYLFEPRFILSGFRHLKCIVPTCRSHAKQKMLSSGGYNSTVEVIVAHNHKAPNEVSKKRQMFPCIIGKKINADTGLTIEHIYDDDRIQDPGIKELLPLDSVSNEIYCNQLPYQTCPMTYKTTPINSFDDFFHAIDEDSFKTLRFTQNKQQFYQEKFSIDQDGSMAVLFGNIEVIQQVPNSKVMYVDTSFKIDTNEAFKYQLVTVLVWRKDSYYPILFALVNKKSQLMFRRIFEYLRNDLAPNLRPQEIITEYEANIYYALAEIYFDSTIGASVFYYTQNLYKKVCSLNLSHDLQTNFNLHIIYYKLLMLPLLPVNTIVDGLKCIEMEAKNLGIYELARPLLDYVNMQWILNVSPELFCVFKLENRINENVSILFRKLRNLLEPIQNKLQRAPVNIAHVIEKIIEFEDFLREMYSKPNKKSYGRDPGNFHKKKVLREWQFIEEHPKIDINNFFNKVLGYLKCMQNQLWIWGFYRYGADTNDILINALHFSIVPPSDEMPKDIAESTIVTEAITNQNKILQAGDEIVANENTVNPSLDSLLLHF